MEVTIQGELRRYKMLHVLDFDPTRKRMSVMVQDEDSESITWFKQYFSRSHKYMHNMSTVLSWAVLTESITC